MKNKKKVISMLLGMALTVAVLGGIFAAPRFTDVPANHWAAASISKMAQGGLIAGYGNNKFGPNDKFNIDQMATIIARQGSAYHCAGRLLGIQCSRLLRE